MKFPTPLLTSLFLCMAFSCTAVAQAELPVRVIVTPFTYSPGYRHDELALLTEKTFRAELLKSSHYEPIPEDEVSKAARRLGIGKPYERPSLTLLARELRATHIVSGEVLFFGTEGSSKLRVAKVEVWMRMRDIATNDLVNGAASVGEVKTSFYNIDAFSRVTLSAAADCAAKMTSYKVPEGIILNTMSFTGPVAPILVNRGSRDGLALGDGLRVLRNGEKVGKLRVSRVFPTDSEVEIVENFQGIRPTDTVRFIFPESRLALPGFKVEEEKSFYPPPSHYGTWD
jgi:hypothetical protein